MKTWNISGNCHLCLNLFKSVCMRRCQGSMKHLKKIDSAKCLPKDPHRKLLKKDKKPTINQVAWVIAHINDHQEAGTGSFGSLIYNRMGFAPEAYTPLYLAGGMAISNRTNK